MGCCVSREKNRAKHDPHFPCISKSPPLLDEETVKEVLSETPQPQTRPKPKPNSGPIHNVGPDPGPDPDPDPEPEVMQILKPTYTKPNSTVIRQKHLPINPIKSPGSGRVPEPEEVSDVSEICSLSESISTATLREDEYGTHNDGSEVVQRVYKHKPHQGQNGNFTHGSNRGRVSPGRVRSDPSPTRVRNPGPGQGPGQGPGRVGRRSRSPVTRSNNVGQSPTRRRAGPSPGRVRMVSGPDRENEGKKMEEVNEKRRGINDNEDEWDGPNESLDNPLVSLECFIFL